MRRATGGRGAGKCAVLAAGVAALITGTWLATGCTPSIAGVNGSPDQYYGRQLTLCGHIGDVLARAESGEPTVFHLVSEDRHRIIVLAPPGTARRSGDRICARGELSRERSVGKRTFYDVLVASRVQARRRLIHLPFLL